MIFNMTGGGSGSGATLIVSCPANVTVTVSKDDKSYTKNSGNLGSATFKGLATGEWTVTIEGNEQTATKNITITADYAITMAFFAAYINITYPANSTCTVKTSGGTIVASNSNTGSSTKTWTATVGATGTYTITATSTSDSSKTKSTTVDITTDGQSSSVTLKYSLDIIVNGKFNTEITGSWRVVTSGSGSMSENDGGYVEILAPVSSYTDWSSAKVLPTSEYTTLYVDYSAVLNGYTSQFLAIGGVSVGTNSTSSDARNTRAVDISGLTSDYQMSLIARAWAGNGGVSIYIYNMYLA